MFPYPLQGQIQLSRSRAKPLNPSIYQVGGSSSSKEPEAAQGVLQVAYHTDLSIPALIRITGNSRETAEMKAGKSGFAIAYFGDGSEKQTDIPNLALVAAAKKPQPAKLKGKAKAGQKKPAAAVKASKTRAAQAVPAPEAEALVPVARGAQCRLCLQERVQILHQSMHH